MSLGGAQYFIKIINRASENVKVFHIKTKGGAARLQKQPVCEFKRPLEGFVKR